MHRQDSDQDAEAPDASEFVSSLQQSGNRNETCENSNGQDDPYGGRANPKRKNQNDRLNDRRCDVNDRRGRAVQHQTAEMQPRNSGHDAQESRISDRAQTVGSEEIGSEQDSLRDRRYDEKYQECRSRSKRP